MTSKRSIFFDVGNVLLYFSMQRMWEQMGKVLGVSSSIIEKEFVDTGLGEKYERGLIDTQLFYDHFCRVAKKNIPIEVLTEAASNMLTPNPSMLPLLQELKSKGHQLFVLSNTNETHYTYARRHFPEFFAPFDDYLLSFRLGAIKPEEIIYKVALKRANMPADQCFYTDDIPAYIEAAAKLHLPGAVFTGEGPLREELKTRGIL